MANKEAGFIKFTRLKTSPVPSRSCGDSTVNTVSMMVGFALAWLLPIWMTVTNRRGNRAKPRLSGWDKSVPERAHAYYPVDGIRPGRPAALAYEAKS
jgi:hypothetical protein